MKFLSFPKLPKYNKELFEVKKITHETNEIIATTENFFGYFKPILKDKNSPEKGFLETRGTEFIIEKETDLKIEDNIKINEYDYKVSNLREYKSNTNKIIKTILVLT